MRAVFLISMLVNAGRLVSQDSIAFDFNSPNPEFITHIYINLNFNKVSKIPEHIGLYQNLKELVFLGQETTFHASNRNRPQHNKLICMEEMPINSIPPALANCSSLEVLKVPEGDITLLPEQIVTLTSLRILRLPDCSDLDTLLPIVLKLRSLEELQCILCQLSETNREHLFMQKPDLNIIVSQDDIFRAMKTTSKFYVVVDDIIWHTFDREIEAKMFYRSTPEEDRLFYNISLHK